MNRAKEYLLGLGLGAALGALITLLITVLISSPQTPAPIATSTDYPSGGKSPSTDTVNYFFGFTLKEGVTVDAGTVKVDAGTVKVITKEAVITTYGGEKPWQQGYLNCTEIPKDLWNLLNPNSQR